MANILVVDDIEQMQELMELLIKSQGHEVKTCASGIEVMDILENFECDLIFMDMNLKNEKGIQVCRNIKQNNEWADIPICFVSADSKKSDIISALSVGGNDYIVKPVSQKSIREKLEKLIVKRAPGPRANEKYKKVDLVAFIKGMPIVIPLRVRHISRQAMFVITNFNLKLGTEFKTELPGMEVMDEQELITGKVEECTMLENKNFCSKINFLNTPNEFEEIFLNYQIVD